MKSRPFSFVYWLLRYSAWRSGQVLAIFLWMVCLFPIALWEFFLFCIQVLWQMFILWISSAILWPAFSISSGASWWMESLYFNVVHLTNYVFYDWRFSIYCLSHVCTPLTPTQGNEVILLNSLFPRYLHTSFFHVSGLMSPCQRGPSRTPYLKQYSTIRYHPISPF